MEGLPVRHDFLTFGPSPAMEKPRKLGDRRPGTAWKGRLRYHRALAWTVFTPVAPSPHLFAADTHKGAYNPERQLDVGDEKLETKGLQSHAVAEVS